MQVLLWGRGIEGWLNLVSDMVHNFTGECGATAAMAGVTCCYGVHRVTLVVDIDYNPPPICADGLAIGLTFVVGTNAGISTSVAVVFCEIPQVRPGCSFAAALAPVGPIVHEVSVVAALPI